MEILVQYRARPAGLWCCGQSGCVSLCPDGGGGSREPKRGFRNEGGGGRRGGYTVIFCKFFARISARLEK